MDSFEFRFCRVCLVPEDEEKFFSIFNDNARVAQQLHNLTNIFPVDVDEKVPSLICKACTKEVDATDLLRRRILDANDHIAMMTVEREIDYFEEFLKEIRDDIERARKREERRKKLEEERTEAGTEPKLVETPINRPVKAPIIVSCKKVVGARICLRRSKECEEKIAKIMNSKPMPIVAPMTVIPMSFHYDENSRQLNDITANPKPPKLHKENKKLGLIKIKLPKKKNLGSKKRKIADSTEINSTDQPGNQKKHKRFKETPKVKVRTTFECDTCEEFFYTCSELDEHLKVHRSKFSKAFQMVQILKYFDFLVDKTEKPWHDFPQSTIVRHEVVIINGDDLEVNHQTGHAAYSSSVLADVIEID